MKLILNNLAKYMFLCFIFGALQFYECKICQNSSVTAPQTFLSIKRPVNLPQQYSQIQKNNVLYENLHSVNKNDRSCEYIADNAAESEIYNFARNKNMVYTKILLLMDEVRSVCSSIKMCISNFSFDMNVKMQDLRWDSLNIVNRTLHVFLIIAAAMMIFILKWTSRLFKYRCLRSFELLRRPLLQEIENIKHDTSLLAGVIKENNEKLSRIIITKEIEQNTICKDTMTYLRGIADSFQSLLKRKKRVKHMNGKSRRKVYVKREKVLQHKHTSSQTEQKRFENKFTSSSNDDICSNLDITKYTSVRETISLLHNKQYSSGNSIFTRTDLWRRPQRVWIGGKWYLEDRNELREAYSPPLLQNNKCCTVKMCKESELNEHNTSFTTADIAQVRCSTPSNASTTPSFLKYMKNQETNSCKSYKSEETLSPLVKCQRRLYWNSNFQSSNLSNSCLSKSIEKSSATKDILGFQKESASCPRTFTCRSLNYGAPSHSPKVLPNRNAEAIKDTWRSSNKKFDVEDVFMNAAGQLTKQKLQQVRNDGCISSEKKNSSNSIKFHPNQILPAIHRDMLKDATNLPFRIKNKSVNETFNVRCNRSILKQFPPNQCHPAVKHVTLQL